MKGGDNYFKLFLLFLLLFKKKIVRGIRVRVRVQNE
jgi:hypothetical protein